MEDREGSRHHAFGVGAHFHLKVPRSLIGNSLDVAEIEEPCAHGVQFGGMCVSCGKDMTEYVPPQSLSNTIVLVIAH